MSTPRNPHRDSHGPIIETLRATGWGQRIDAHLRQRPGPRSPITADALFTVIAILGHTGRSYQHERALAALVEMPEYWQRELDIPLRPASRTERRLTGRRTIADISMHQVFRKFHACIQALQELEGGLDEFTSDLLWEAIPEEARHLRHIAIDGTPMNVWARARERQDILDDPNADWDYHIRNKEKDKKRKGDKKTKPSRKSTIGYLNMNAVLFDPTDEITTPYIVGMKMATGAASEGRVAASVLRQVARKLKGLDLVIADGGIANVIEMYETTRELGGDLVFRPTLDQQDTVSLIGTTGYVSFLGRAFSPSANLAALSANEDGEKRFPTVPPRSSDSSDNQEWLDTLEAWFEDFENLDPFTARNIGHTDIERKTRVTSPGKGRGRTINCCEHCGPHRNDLPTGPNPPAIPPPSCVRATVTIHADDHPMRTWQPFEYGSRAWAHLYFGGRDRVEGVVADIRENMHLKGGRNACRIRGLNPFGMLSAVLGMTRNLQLAHRLLPPSGRVHQRGTRRIYKIRPSARKKMMRVLNRRARDRQVLINELDHIPATSNAPPRPS